MSSRFGNPVVSMIATSSTAPPFGWGSGVPFEVPLSLQATSSSAPSPIASEFSLDDLSPEEEKMFIEAGTYYLGQPLECALAAWSTAYGDAETRWAKLLSKSLVKEVPKSVNDKLHKRKVEYVEVWVDEHLRNQAKTLGSAANAAVSAVDQGANSAVDLLNVNAVNGETAILQLLYTDEYVYWEKTHAAEARVQKTLDLHSLEKLERLKYLDLDSVPHTEMAESNLPRNLSVLRWKGKSTAFDNINHHRRAPRPRWELPLISLKEMNNLAILELKDWRVSTKTPEALGELVSLRILSLCQLDGLDRLPDDFGNLSRLKWLELTDLSLSTLPESFGNLWSLEHLIVYRSDISELPESFGNLSSLATLHIRDCEKLASLPHSFGNLSSLKELGIRDCASLKHLGDLFGSLSALRDLSFHECPSLESLPATFGDLPALQTMSIKMCRNLVKLSANFGQLSALERLNLLGNDNLRELSDTFGKLPALKSLSITSCPSLERLPDNFGFLLALERLELKQCSRLQVLPDSFSQLLALNWLSLWEIHCLELGDKFLFPPSIQDFGINCNNLERLPESIGELELLQTLTVEGNGLEMLCNGIRNLSALEKLKIYSTRLESLPRGLGQLKSLKEMTISVQRLRSLPEDLGDLRSLQSLTICRCDVLESLPESLGRIPSLQSVELWNNDRLKSLPYSLGKLSLSYGDGNKRFLQSLCSRGATETRAEAKKFMELDVRWCPRLDDSVLERFGWVRDPGDLLYVRRPGGWPRLRVTLQMFHDLTGQLRL